MVSRVVHHDNFETLLTYLFPVEPFGKDDFKTFGIDSGAVLLDVLSSGCPGLFD